MYTRMLNVKNIWNYVSMLVVDFLGRLVLENMDIDEEF